MRRSIILCLVGVLSLGVSCEWARADDALQKRLLDLGADLLRGAVEDAAQGNRTIAKASRGMEDMAASLDAQLKKYAATLEALEVAVGLAGGQRREQLQEEIRKIRTLMAQGRATLDALRKRDVGEAVKQLSEFGKTREESLVAPANPAALTDYIVKSGVLPSSVTKVIQGWSEQRLLGEMKWRNGELERLYKLRRDADPKRWRAIDRSIQDLKRLIGRADEVVKSLRTADASGAHKAVKAFRKVRDTADLSGRFLALLRQIDTYRALAEQRQNDPAVAGPASELVKLLQKRVALELQTVDIEEEIGGLRKRLQAYAPTEDD